MLRDSTLPLPRRIREELSADHKYSLRAAGDQTLVFTADARSVLVFVALRQERVPLRHKDGTQNAKVLICVDLLFGS